MRNPDRIPIILEKLEVLWKRMPDLRLGQLLENVKYASPGQKIDTFAVEDHDIEKGIDVFLSNTNKGGEGF